jgi:hypothetical protein
MRRTSAAKIGLFVTASLLFSLSGCITTPSSVQLASADYGPAPSENYQQQIREYMMSVLKDPMSAQYQFSAPTKGWMHDAPIAGGKIHYCWKVDTKINAKNGFGGYNGFKSYTFWFQGGKVISATDESGFGFTPNGNLQVITP